MSSTTPAGSAIPDVQSKHDARQVAIDRVGVKNVTYPFVLHTPEGGEQPTVASINMYVALPHHQKGTHMSRFLEVLNEHNSHSCTIHSSRFDRPEEAGVPQTLTGHNDYG
jgi:GTP cyclohydrolase I